jgi:hypothetical protein
MAGRAFEEASEIKDSETTHALTRSPRMSWETPIARTSFHFGMRRTLTVDVAHGRSAPESIPREVWNLQRDSPGGHP